MTPRRAATGSSHDAAAAGVGLPPFRRSGIVAPENDKTSGGMHAPLSRSRPAVACCRCASGCGGALSRQADPGACSARSGRPVRRVHARARRGAACFAGRAVSWWRTAPAPRARIGARGWRRRAARRLHDLHPSTARSMVINPLIFKKIGFDPRRTWCRSRGCSTSRRCSRSTLSLGVKSFAELAALTRAKPKTLNYMAPSLSKVAFMEEFNNAARHRLRARAVQGRRRRDQRHDDRHDADRDLRHRQYHAVSSGADRSSDSPSTATRARRSRPIFRPSASSATRYM